MGEGWGGWGEGPFHVARIFPNGPSPLSTGERGPEKSAYSQAYLGSGIFGCEALVFCDGCIRTVTDRSRRTI